MMMVIKTMPLELDDDFDQHGLKRLSAHTSMSELQGQYKIFLPLGVNGEGGD